MSTQESTSSIDDFYDHPILNSPYQCPTRYWELDGDGRPTQNINNERRPADFITPIPKPRKRTVTQGELFTDDTADSISTDSQQYHKDIILGKPSMRWE